MPYEDLNQSSRLELDYDPDNNESFTSNESDGAGGNHGNVGHNASRYGMSGLGQIAESSSEDEDESQIDDSRRSREDAGRSRSSPVMVETVSDSSSEGLSSRERGKQPQQYHQGGSSMQEEEARQRYKQDDSRYEQQPQQSSYSNHSNGYSSSQQRHHQETNGYTTEPSSSYEPSYPRGGDNNGYSSSRNKNEEDEYYRRKEGGGERGRGESSDRGGGGTYHSTLDTSTSSRHKTDKRNEGETSGNSKKLVKIKLWDPGESSSSSSEQATVVTLAMELANNLTIPSPQQGKDSNGALHDTMPLGVGQRVNLEQQYGGKNGERTVDISWQSSQSQQQRTQSRINDVETSWQPPFDISKDEQQQTYNDNDQRMRSSPPPPLSPQPRRKETLTPSTQEQRQHAEEKKETYPDSNHMPQPPPPQPTKSTVTSSSEPQQPSSKTTTTPAQQQPVKSLEPFTIPSILSTTIIKRTPTEKVGLAFRKANGTVVIEKIAPNSAFDATALRPGYECLCINGHRLRSARRAAEIVRESGSSLTLMASNAPRPPGTMYTMISLDDQYHSDTSLSSCCGMHFKIKHGLVQLDKVDKHSPLGGNNKTNSSSSMKVGDFILAINGQVIGSVDKAVEVLLKSLSKQKQKQQSSSSRHYSGDELIPILYFNMRQLRVSLVDKVIGDLWKKEWSEGYDECIVLQPRNENNSPSNDLSSLSNHPLTLRFKEEGMCELLDPLRGFRNDKNGSNGAAVPKDHPLNSVVETLNHGIICVLSAIREGVELATTASAASNTTGTTMNDDGNNANNNTGSNSGSGGDFVSELAKLSEMYKEGLLSKDDFDAIKSKLLK